MDHFIEPGGKFDVACAELLALGWKLPYADTAPDAKPKKTPSNGANVVWLYPSCGRKSWGSPTIRPICGYCIEAMEGTATNDALAVDNDWQRYLGPALAVARDKIGALLDDNVSDAEVDGAEDEAVDDEGEVEGDEMEGVKVVAVPIPPVDQVAELRAELRAERTAHAVTKKLLAVANATIQQLRPKLN